MLYTRNVSKAHETRDSL